MQPAQAITILLVDHHALVRSGISLLLNGYSDFRVAGSVSTAEEAMNFAEEQPVDVVITDVDLRGSIGAIDLIGLFHRRWPKTHFVVLTNSVDPDHIHMALRQGALGYVLKTISTDELARAVRAAYQGIPTLSPEVTQALIDQTISPTGLIRSLTAREQQVLSLMARGWNNQQIAVELHISLSTVQFHVSNILAKLDVHNRTEAAAFALRHQSGPSQNWAGGRA